MFQRRHAFPRPARAARSNSPAIERLEDRTLFDAQLAPINISLTSTNVYPTNGSFALIARVTPAPGGPTPLGSFTFYDGTTSLGSVGLNPDGTATILPFIQGSGDHVLTASYSGDADYGGVTSAPITEHLSGAAALHPTVHGTLPASAIGGQKTRIRQSVAISIPAGFSLKGLVGGQLFLASGGTIDSNAVLLPQTLSRKVNLNGHNRATLNIAINSLPANIPTGNYHLLVKLNDASGSIVTADSGASIHVEAPRTDLSGAFGKIPATGRAGKRFGVTITVTNNGNIPEKGRLPIALEPSLTGVQDANLSPVATKPLNLQPGHSIRMQINGLIAPQAGTYVLIGELDPANTFGDVNLANNTFVSAGLLTVG